MKFVAAILLGALVLEFTPSALADAGEAKRNKCNSTNPTDDQWDGFVQRFNKTYKNCTEEAMRRNLRRLNVQLIAAHNADAAKGKHSYFMAENGFIDLTDAEFKSTLGFRVNSNSRRKRATYYPAIYKNTVPVSTLNATVNWTAQGWVGPVLNQGTCGSCWSYSATGAIEGQYKNKTKTLVQLSEQNLIDCSRPLGNNGCNGGDPVLAFKYVMQYGQQLLTTYPNSASTAVQTCKFLASRSVVKLSGYSYVDFNNELALQQAVAKVGPISIAIDASTTSFRYYSGGIFNDTLCKNGIQNLNHAVLLVGYGTSNGAPYWLIKNSWSTAWGEKGYFRLARNATNRCGVASYASFPIIGTATVAGR